MADYLNKYKKTQKGGGRSNNADPKPGEIWWVANLDGVKDRPILVISCDGGTVRFRRCTSQTSTTRRRDLIEEYIWAGLEKETYVDEEVRTTSVSRLVRRLGELSDYDRQKFGL